MTSADINSWALLIAAIGGTIGAISSLFNNIISWKNGQKTDAVAVKQDVSAAKVEKQVQVVHEVAEAAKVQIQDIHDIVNGKSEMKLAETFKAGQEGEPKPRY